MWTVAKHDMRNLVDMLVLNKVSSNVMYTEGIAMVQNITRPLGIPIQHRPVQCRSTPTSWLTSLRS